MTKIIKKEYHQVISEFEAELTSDILSEIYPDKTEEEIEELLESVENGDADIDQIMSDGLDNDVILDWDRTYDDWWTDRKGGYDVTFEVSQSDNSEDEDE